MSEYIEKKAVTDTSDSHLLDMLLEAINYVYKQLDGKYDNLSYVVSDKVKYIERVRAEKIEQKMREEYEARDRGEDKQETDFEAEIERWWNERYAKLKKDYKFAQMSGHYLDNETIIDLASHFAEWERKRTLDKAVGWMKKNLTYIHPRKGVETCMVNIPAFFDAMNEQSI